MYFYVINQMPFFDINIETVIIMETLFVAVVYKQTVS